MPEKRGVGLPASWANLPAKRRAISLGVFDGSFKLLKWFDQVAIVRVNGTVVEQPKLVTENACKPPVEVPSGNAGQP